MQIQTEKRTPMSENPFGAFIDLITLDQKIRTTHNEITKLKTSMEEHTSQKREITDRFEQFKSHVKELRKMVDTQELEMKELDAKEREKKAFLDDAKKTKEYQSIKKEIEHLKNQQHDAEAHLLGIWNKLEVAQKELQDQQTSFDGKIEEINTVLTDLQIKIDAAQKELESLKKNRPAKESIVPSEWLDKYTHMRMRVSDPVVSVMRNGCSACFYTITNQELIRLQRRALIQCKGCFRLLYMKEAMEEIAGPEKEIQK